MLEVRDPLPWSRHRSEFGSGIKSHKALASFGIASQASVLMCMSRAATRSESRLHQVRLTFRYNMAHGNCLESTTATGWALITRRPRVDRARHDTSIAHIAEQYGNGGCCIVKIR